MKRRNIQFALGTTILLYLMFVVFYTVPTWIDARALQDEIAFTKMNINRLGAFAHDRDTTPRLSRALTELEARMIEQTAGVPFLESLDALAEKHLLQTDVKFLKEPLGQRVELIPLQIVMKGPLDRMLAYLDDLEHQSFFTALQSVDIQTDSEQSNSVQATVTVDTLWK